MKRLLSFTLILFSAAVLFLTMAATTANAKETLNQTWNYGTHYGTVNPNVKMRKYTVIPCQEGDIIQLDFPSDNWAVYVHFADAQGDFGLEYLYRKGKPECVVIKEINGRMPTELRLTTFYRPNTSATITDALWETFDVRISKSTVLPGDLLGSAQWKQGSYENPSATIRRHCQIPCKVGDTFRFDFTGAFWDLYILPGDENGAITLTNTYLSSDRTYTVKQVDGKNPTNLILVAVPGESLNINDEVWQSFAVSCVKESNTFVVASQNYGLWYNGVTQGVEMAEVETAAEGWRQMVRDHKVDILCGQEWLPDFDRDKTIDANDKVFGKIFEYQFAQNTSTYDGKHIASKTPLTDTQYITHGNGSGRRYAKAYTQINGKTVCIVNAHLSFEEDININRKEEIVELLNAIQNEKYVVLAGDFNVFTADEFKIFEDAGYRIANAGAFGEFNTWPNFGINAGAAVNRCLDNIIVSPGIAIRNAYVDYRELSDHAMLVAEMEILEDGTFTDNRLFCEHCNQFVQWIPCPLTDGGAANTIQQNGHFYMTQDLMNVTSAFQIAAADVVLDLRGHTIHAPSARACYIKRGGKLSVVDTIGCGEISTNYTGTGAVVYIEGTGELALFDGAIRAKDNTTAKNGGAIYAETDANLTVMGGEIYGSYASKGGAISAGNRNTIRIEGGTIYGSRVTGDGGAVWLYNGTLTMTGGTIVGGQANNGGAICGNGAVVNLYGGTISGGKAAVFGGNYYGLGNSSSGCLNLGNCNITGGRASNCGHDIYLATTGKIKVLTSFAANASMWVDGSHYNDGDLSTWETCEGLFPGKLSLENAGGKFLCGATGDTRLHVASVCLVKNDGDKLWFANNADATGAYGDGSGYAYLKPVSGMVSLSGGNYTLDVAGQEIVISGSGTLSCVDSANDSYALSAGKVTVPETVKMVLDVTGGANGYRYIAVAGDDGSYSFHRLDAKVTKVVLRPSAAGIYYKATYNCDSLLASKVQTYGVIVSVTDMPGADFLEEMRQGQKNAYTSLSTGFAPGVEATSGSVFNIMKTGNRPEVNVANGETKIYANAYICLDGLGIVVGDTENLGKKASDEGFTGVAWSLFDVLEALDSAWDSCVAAGQDGAIKNFYNAWTPYGISAWAERFKNIDA